jgi:UDP-N-acetylglucosamine diphosphorylase / glucose-1-phosphate thymidylyltransferase / UDP-N-acetylgalactosamine diphosphorylase / glucosamine-1-phosphate N-acetyltransferase / galactosamine-1-phosphate N-acetyltransferase
LTSPPDRVASVAIFIKSINDGLQVDMNVSDLFSAEMEPDLNDWVRKFASLGDLFSAMPQLYANLRAQNIQGVVEDGAMIIGAVHIGIGSVVHGQAIIRGPAIVGNNTVVDSHAEIRAGSFIGSNCVIGHSCSIIESMVMGNVNVCSGAFIRNSLLGFGSVVGPGAALGAEEVERSLGLVSETSSKIGVVLGDYAVVGANSSIKPGTVVGSYTIIGEGVLAGGIYQPNQTVTLSQALETKPRSSVS